MTRRLCGTAALTLAVVPASALAAPATQEPPPPALRGSAGAQLLLPLVKSGRIYDDVLAEVYSDGGIRYNRESLIRALSPLLADAGRQRFAASLPTAPTLSPDDVARSGVSLRYDPTRLEVVIARIEPSMSAVEMVGGADPSHELPITARPEDFSAYLNLVGDLRVTDFRSFDNPGLLLFGAVRYRGVVAEFDGGYDSSLGSGSGFYRRSARLVYDQIDELRRWSAGDLQLNGLPITAGALLGGVAVEKGRRVFTGLAPLRPLGGQQILLDRDSTIEVIVDGQQVQTLQLSSGSYDLSQLRAQFGARNAQLYVTDITGRRQLTSIDPFFNPVDLLQGEDEYSAGIGFVPKSFNAQPVYGGLPAFAGYYRRGITNRLILGGTLQLSKDIQVAGAEVIVSPRAIPGRFELSAAASTGGSSGIALRGGYSVEMGIGAHARQLSVNADYRSRGFATVTELIGGGRFETLNLNANFSQNLNDQNSIVSGLSWFRRQGLPTVKTAYVDFVHRTRRFRLTAGVEYGTGLFDRNYGVRFGVSIPLGRRNRVEANYNSRRDEFRAFAARSYEETVGSFGYDIGVNRSSDNASVDGILNYVGNRFYSRLTLTTAGNGLSNIARDQTARLQVGTAIAFTDGAIAIGRPINDSFVIAEAHPSLKRQDVILTRSVSDRRYLAESGPLGPALGGRLNSYTPQSIIYDLKNGAQGYDIGSGIERVEPAYRSGYHLVVGSDATVTAFGFLDLPGGRAQLVSGTITSADDADFGTQPFFTNSVGRFAVPGLRPGKTYAVHVNQPDSTFTVSVPKDSKSLLRLDQVTVTPHADGGQE